MKPKSIIQRDTECYICRILGKRNPYTEEHHIFYGPNRKNSTKYRLTCRLCTEHHRNGPDAVHKTPNAGWDIYLKELGQRAFEKEYPQLDFKAIFGRNYL